jgi:hypothetical protein
MANGITTATKDDAAIQAARWNRAVGRLGRQRVGYCIGWGFESDYLGAENMKELTRLHRWLKLRDRLNGRRRHG